MTENHSIRRGFYLGKHLPWIILNGTKFKDHILKSHNEKHILHSLLSFNNVYYDITLSLFLRIFLRKNRNNIHFICISVSPLCMYGQHMNECLMIWEVGRGHGILYWESNSVGCKLLCGSWESNMGPIQENQLLLITRPFLQTSF